MCADDLTAEPGIDQVRDPADVIDVGKGEKQKVDVCRRHREPVEGHLRVMALGNAAVHQDGNGAAVVRLSGHHNILGSDKFTVYIRLSIFKKHFNHFF
ncbi:hypothetical protein Dpo_5c03670 [Desulfotignum phosphitoxidans DSM 13687]|uniref:Uncharacterized protein n=1 Tax=Desulfotignum phosphitoxidans DSM 13687 TaxID=1286635 RepID=S0FXH3_9BACT|nr:hypothetical protein Dpo_5c03670 [Desulfotignum phosphitoxidans DSM 13687]